MYPHYCRFLKVLHNLDKKMNGHGFLGNIVKDLSDQAYFVSEFHEELRRRLHSAAKMYLSDDWNDEVKYSACEIEENIGDVFQNMKPRFLVYAPFVEMCNNVENMITVMKYDPSVLQDVESLEKQMRTEMAATKNWNLPTTFNALLALPFQHVLRWVAIISF